MSQEWNNILNRMSKPELLDLARSYNRSFDKIKNLQKLKKAELRVELLMREKKAKKIWSGKNIVKPIQKNKARKSSKKLSNEAANDLIEESIKLAEEAIVTKDLVLKNKLLEEIHLIRKKLSKEL